MELYHMTAHELGRRLKRRELGAVELTLAVLERIEKVDPVIGSYITVCREEAVKQAEEAQRKLDGGGAVSPLAGIPMAVKDNLCTEGILTTCASRMLCNFIPPYDATTVKKLKESGSVILGKSNMDEFAMGGSTETSFYKKTRNPWDIERVPGGSSGGSAAAVASGLAFYSLGSDTGGSVRQPAAFCGVVGMKPTYGLISRYGLVAFASSLDQVGPITRDVTDCALVLKAIAGHDEMDSTSVPVDVPDYEKALVNDVRGLRVGIPREYLEGSRDWKGPGPEVRSAVLNSVEVLKNSGALCEEFSMPYTEYAIPAYCIISSAEASSNLGRYDGVKYGYRTQNYEALSDLYNNTRSEGFGAEVKRRILLGTYALSSGYYDACYKKALQVRRLIRGAFEKAFEKYDLIVCPTTPETAYKAGAIAGQPLKMYLDDRYTAPVNIAGLPAISVPCGLDADNLPVGLQFIGKPFDESLLLRAAYTFEQNTGYHGLKPVKYEVISDEL